MINVIFATAKYKQSSGELTNAILFCRSLPQDKYNCYFIAAENEWDYLNNLGIKTLNAQEVTRQKFDAVVISDYYPLVRSIAENTCDVEEKNIYEYLLSLNIPVLIIDMLGMYGSYVIKNPKYSCLTQKLCLNPFTRQCNPINCNPVKFKILYPAPPHHPSPLKKHQMAYFPILPLTITEEENNNIKNKLGIKRKDSKIIFMSISNWEYRIMKERGQAVYFFVLEKLLINYLSQLKEKIDFIIVSPIPFYNSYTMGDINVKHIPITSSNIIPLEQYEKMFLIADLILTDNIIQSTFIRAVTSGIPGINIISNIAVEKKDGDNYDLIPTFDINPFTSELLNIMERSSTFLSSKINNTYIGDFFLARKTPLYQQLFASCELFDQSNMVNTMQKYLYDENYKKNFNELREQYVKLIRALPDADSIIQAL